MQSLQELLLVRHPGDDHAIRTPCHAEQVIPLPSPDLDSDQLIAVSRSLGLGTREEQRCIPALEAFIEKGQHAGRAHRQALGHRAGPIVQGCHRFHHTGTRFLRYPCSTTENARDSRDGYPGSLGDVIDCCFHGFPLARHAFSGNDTGSVALVRSTIALYTLLRFSKRSFDRL